MIIMQPIFLFLRREVSFGGPKFLNAVFIIQKWDVATFHSANGGVQSFNVQQFSNAFCLTYASLTGRADLGLSMTENALRPTINT
jgi:hypothetical protein